MSKNNRNNIAYELNITTTSDSAGYFSCMPKHKPKLDETLAYILTNPNDEFIRKYALHKIASMSKEQIIELVKQNDKNKDFILSMIYEIYLIYENLGEKILEWVSQYFNDIDLKELVSFSPLIYIKSALLEDQKSHAQWTTLFQENLFSHFLLPPPEALGLDPLFSDDHLKLFQKQYVNINQIHETTSNCLKDVIQESCLEKISNRALTQLEKIDIFDDIEKSHMASLSPYGLLRKWKISVSVKNNNLKYSLTGIQTSYGKGLSLQEARISYLMEIVERCSSFASINENRILNRTCEYPLTHTTYKGLQANGINSLNPNDLWLEVPYQDEPLYWMEANIKKDGNLYPIMIPVQTVFLFCNLDEINLFSGLGSTGLASGTTIAGAKLSAILETIERDCENTCIYSPDKCFKLISDDPKILKLLQSYAAKGIHVQFQDLTSEIGIPCYKSFVINTNGQIIKGAAAHLDAKKAILSALTETPYSLLEGKPSAQGVAGIQIKKLEDFPNYSCSDPEKDLELLEKLLNANQYTPIYVDLTRKDLDIPVFKALIPGMELIADFDQFSRVSPRLYISYLNYLGKRDEIRRQMIQNIKNNR